MSALVINNKEEILLALNHKGLYGSIKDKKLSQFFIASIYLVGGLAILAAGVNTWAMLGHIPHVLHFINAFSSLHWVGVAGFAGGGAIVLAGALSYHQTKHKRFLEMAEIAQNTLDTSLDSFTEEIKSKLKVNQRIIFKFSKDNYWVVTKQIAGFQTIDILKAASSLDSVSWREIK